MLIRKRDSFVLVVALVTLGRGLEVAVGVAIDALYLFMAFVKHLSGDRVIEGVRPPFLVAGVTVRALLHEGYVFVAVPARACPVIPAKRPAGIGVVERFDREIVLLPVTSFAPSGDHSGALPHICFMATNARSMVLAHCARLSLGV